VTPDELDELLLESLNRPKPARYLVMDVLDKMRGNVQERIRALLDRGDIELDRNLDLKRAQRSEPNDGG
jgi:hypothetical protein